MIALIGSEGPLTVALTQALRHRGEASMTCALGVETVLEPASGPVTFRLEHLGTLLRHLRDRGVEAVCFAGGIARPQVDPSRIDAATMPLVPRLLAALGKGDDGALRVALGIFEEAGFVVRAAHEIAPDLLPAAGVLTAAQPTAQHESDARRAEEVHRLLAAADVGQGVIVRRGQVVAVEAQPGTDFMLRSVRGHADGALFLKAPKRGQDRRADLPVIGVHTVALAQEAGLAAIVLESGGVMVIDRAATVAAADAAGVVLWVREPDA
ncbi:LpxI family protein [Rubellimicrobium roseum]|uniref:LpxI family protein n=1 Tax=Rubellimicrobium roseum TaxID=687525 RepID=A0A5C4NEV2_9RHOB|nr:UDP-2,3-diacylglucosamine diphosphatase LpxI [Rubellimicrobium roseum]TNC69491.1 LpxI family protein [Rubellimicrobium roseum]